MLATPMVLVVEDDPDLGEALGDTLRAAEIPVCVATDGHAAWQHIREGNIGLVISDVQMSPMDGYALLERVRKEEPGLPMVMMTAYATVDRAVRAMREGADDYLVKPFDAKRLIAVAQRYLATARVTEGPIAEDPASVRLLALARRAALSDATLLISGESGTGKEVLARYIHQQSPRANGPFVAINCAAIPESLLESTLFGHEKGAFTGAQSARAGTFERAQGGTLLLDEVSEMALPLQAKLLRVLQEREVERIGGQRSVALDVRVLATTNRALLEQVRQGQFREDLYYRLNVFPLTIPPLRERRGDILPLVRQQLALHARRLQRTPPSLSAEAEQCLLDYAWPGNVRELDNLVQRALILDTDQVLDRDDLMFEAEGVMIPTPLPAEPRADLSQALRENEDQLILVALQENAGNRRETAAKLGISERTLRYKLARLREQDRLPAEFE